MFKLFELISKISSMSCLHRGLNIAYDEPEDNRFYLQLVAKNRFI